MEREDFEMRIFLGLVGKWHKQISVIREAARLIADDYITKKIYPKEIPSEVLWKGGGLMCSDVDPEFLDFYFIIAQQNVMGGRTI